jgi:hypothetical protein
VADRWFYTHKGKTHGPVSAEEIKRLAATGRLLPTDLLWPEGGDRKRAVLAVSAVSFEPADPPAPVAVPDWLADVAVVERSEPVAPPPKPPAFLDWLDDVREVEGRGLPPAEPIPIPAPPPPAPAADPVPASAPSPPVPVAEAPPEAIPVPLPAAAPAPAVGGAEQTGLDPETGQILDPVLFERWLRQESLERQKELASRPTATIEELFEQARRELERWVDLDENKPLILSGDGQILRQNGRLRAILQPYECWGAEMTARLLRYLEFLVENRRRFYQAF